MLDQQEPIPGPPPEALMPETRQKIVEFVNEGVARPWYAPKPGSTDGSLDLVGVSLPVDYNRNETILLPDDGMSHIGTGEHFLIISLDGNMSVVGTPHEELIKRLIPDRNTNSANYVESDIWNGDILPEVQRGNLSFIYRSYMPKDKDTLLNITRVTFDNAEKIIQANKANKPSATPVKLA